MAVNYLFAHGFKNNLSDIAMQAFNNQTSTNDNYGIAPELIGLTNWINSNPLTLESLKGKVVLIDFWTYSCINCIRTLPHVTSWYEKYKDSGLVIIGVHSPEFDFEKIPTNVERAVKNYNIQYPVALDNDFLTWRAYQNHYWPAHYLINQSGNIVYTHFGEGKYDVMENKIRELLELGTEKLNITNPDIKTGSPEMYFGLNRLANLTAKQKAVEAPFVYKAPEDLSLNTFSLDGKWQFRQDFAELQSTGSIRLRFKAAKVHFVAEASKTVQATILVNGQEIKKLNISSSDLYTVYENDKATDTTLEIRFNQPGVRAFTFTFG